MRLHHGDHLALGRFARRLEHGGDLDRVVAVVVDDGDAVPDAGAGETPAHAAETGERFADHIVADAELMRDRDRRRGIERVVPAGHRQRQVLDLVHEARGAVAEHDGEQRGAAGMRDIDQPHVGLRVLAVGDDAVILDAADEALHHRMVGAHHRKSVERHVLDEGAKRLLHRLEGLEVVEVLGIDIGHDGDVGGKLAGTCRRIRRPRPPSSRRRRAARWCRRR